jgi:hypothetical protein
MGPSPSVLVGVGQKFTAQVKLEPDLGSNAMIFFISPKKWRNIGYFDSNYCYLEFFKMVFKKKSSRNI